MKKIIVLAAEKILEMEKILETFAISDARSANFSASLLCELYDSENK